MKTVLEIMMYLFALLGGIVSLKIIYLWLKPLRKITWKEVERGVLRLKEDLIKANYYPTLIVGIGRGGSIIGALLSGTLGNIPIIVIDRIYVWKDEQREDGFCEEIKISKNIDKVLLVAGELHTGNTARKYTSYFKNMGAKEIKMLSFMKELYPTYKPDFSFIETQKTEIRFPWMITKDYKRESIKNYNAK
jgi:hypoxanthine phosphoribosyltransferase